MPVSTTFGATGGVVLDVSGGDQELPRTARGLYVGATGDAVLLMDDGSQVTFTGLAAGITHPLQFTKIISSGTTVTNSLVLF
jgi:hypothetical protein